MSGSNQNGNNNTVHFGVFDADLRTQELRKHGTRVKLPRQSFQVLQMLLARPGELVSRDELQKLLWPADTFVDFDHGLNNAVKRIRAVLGDSAETPHWIETLPRLGYRFIGPVEAPANGANGHSNGEGSSSRSIPSLPFSTPTASALAALVSEVRPSLRSKWWLWAGGVAALVALAAFGLHQRFRGSDSALDGLRIIPFTSYPGFEFAPSFSPDGNQIAFAWDGGESGSSFDLYVKVVGTDTPIKLTNTSGGFLIPAWSPDGRFIAYSRATLGSASDTGLFLIPAVGGPERKLAELHLRKGMFASGLAWTADSQSLLYSEPAEQEFGSQLALLNVQTREKRVLPKPAAHCVGVGLAQFSPDGRTLASVCMVSFGLGEIYVQSWPTGEPRRIFQAKGDLEGMTWSQDGQSLIYVLDTSLWRISARGGRPERLWFGEGAQSPSIARTGSRLAFTHRENVIDLFRIPLGNEGKTGAPPQRLAPSELSQKSPHYSPDGERIAFESTRSGSPEVWLCDADGSHLVQLTSFGGPLTGTPSWSPDGKRIVFDSRASGRPELYMIDTQGGKPKRFPTNPEGGSVPFWSHDGRWIYFSTELEGTSQLFKVPVEGGKPIQLTTQGGLISKESFDGKRLYYTRIGGTNEIWSVSTDGGDEQRVEGLPSFTWPSWDIVETGLYYFDSVRSDGVHFYDFGTKHSRKVADFVDPPAPFAVGLAVAPDESSLLYSTVIRSTADIELVENFR